MLSRCPLPKTHLLSAKTYSNHDTAKAGHPQTGLQWGEGVQGSVFHRSTTFKFMCVSPKVQTFNPPISEHLYRGCPPFGSQQKTENMFIVQIQTENPGLHQRGLQKQMHQVQLGLCDLEQAGKAPFPSVKWEEHPAEM